MQQAVRCGARGTLAQPLRAVLPLLPLYPSTTRRQQSSHTRPALLLDSGWGRHQRLCGRSTRCCSTASPTPPPSDRRIAWLCGVQRLLPLDASDASRGNGNGSSTSSSSSSSSSSSTSSVAPPPPPPPSFAPLTEADVRLAPAAAAAAAAAGSSTAADGSGGFDAIMVLAGGLARDGGLPAWVHRRLDVARDLHLLQGRQPPIVCLGGGTPHKPDVLAPSGHVIHESTSCASYLLATGVHARSIYKEVSSYDTVGNAYFSLAIHALPAGWRRLAVVTSDFHMPRSRALFAGVYRLGSRSLHGDDDWFSLTFLSSSDEGVFEPDVYAARLDKEAGSLAHWQAVASGLGSLADFHAWLFADHLCYAVPRQGEFGKRTIEDQRLLESY